MNANLKNSSQTVTRLKKWQGVYVFEGFGPDVIAGYSGRNYGTGRRDEFVKRLGLNPENLVLLKQVHSANLVKVQTGKRPGPECQADGMLTQDPDMVLGILTADCVPVFLYDPVRHAAALVHAGWKGLYHGIVRKAVEALVFNVSVHPEDLRAAIGPAIRECCYEVGPEFREYFPGFYKPAAGQEGKGRTDLVGAAFAELLSGGVKKENIEDCGICTSCRNDEFFSYRREPRTPERILSVISLRKRPSGTP